MTVEKGNVSPTIRRETHGHEPLIVFHGSQYPIHNTEAANSIQKNRGLENCIMIDKEKLRVRRLMPVECERLMGFPDGHTIPVNITTDEKTINKFIWIFDQWNTINAKNGKQPKPVTESRVKKWIETISNPETCPDSARYKACGNSMCVNCMEWIGRRIQIVENSLKEDGK